MPVLSEEQRADFNQLELVMTKEFISQQLIHLIGCLDTNEEGGRYTRCDWIESKRLFCFPPLVLCVL